MYPCGAVKGPKGEASQCGLEEAWGRMASKVVMMSSIRKLAKSGGMLVGADDQ